ncbi:MAG: hypothetical protein J6386_10235 [Candidatus Synoicihabitans palmerolidicus]|nr:hypothetical protein [Candidatus Synoicihabitans palmerolidicus]
MPTLVRAVELSDEASSAEESAVRDQLIQECGGSRSVVAVDSIQVDAGKPGG